MAKGSPLRRYADPILYVLYLGIIVACLLVRGCDGGR